MMSMASRRAKLRAEMSGKLQDAYDRICLDVPDADPEAARTAAEIIVKIDELKAEKAARESERKALSSRRRRAKMDYIKNHDEIGAEDRVKIGFLFYISDEPESLLILSPGELLAMPAVSGGAY